MKKIIIAILGGIILFGGIFFFTNFSRSEETSEQAVLQSTLDISRAYVALRYRTDNVLINAEDFADYDAWNSEMAAIIGAWADLEKNALSLEHVSSKITEENVNITFMESAKAYTREEIVNVIESAPRMKKVATLAKYLGIDAKRAQLVLNETQNMISREAYGNEGDVFQTCENQAIVVKNASKVTVFVGTIALTGGTAAIATSGTLAQTAVLVSGADLTLEITDDAAKIALGDKNKISSVAGDVRKITEPASAILMISTLPNNLTKGIDKLNVVVFGADQLNSTIHSGSVVGIKLPTYKGEGSSQTMEVSVLEKSETEEWIIENGGSASDTAEDIERLLIGLGLIEVTEEQNKKPAFNVDGDWVGTLTYTNFVPAPESAGNDLVCQSSAGLPISVPMTIQVTSFPNGPVYSADVNIAGGASCNVFPDGWDRFSSVWEKNYTDVFTMIGGGPLNLKKKAVTISLPTGYSFSGRVSDDGLMISGQATQVHSDGGMVSLRWSVSRQ